MILQLFLAILHKIISNHLSLIKDYIGFNTYIKFSKCSFKLKYWVCYFWDNWKAKSRLLLTSLQLGVWVLSFIWHLPEAISRFWTRDNSFLTNMVILNVPGFLTTIYFWDKEVSDMGAVGPNVGSSGLTLFITSFYG